MSLLLRFASAVAGHGSASAFGAVDELLQPFVDGDYNGGSATSYNGEFAPDDTLITATLASPAVASVESSTDIVLSLTGGMTIATRSGPTDHKRLVIAKSDLSGAITASVGASDNDYDAEVVVSGTDDPMDWYPGDQLTGSIHVQSIAETITDYDLTPSETTPPSGVEYTVVGQAKDVSDADVNRIRLLDVAYDGVSGVQDGSVTESTVYTNRYGESETIHVTPGTYPTTEKVVVEDEAGISGDSGNIVVAPPGWLLIDHYGQIGNAGDTTETLTEINTTDANFLLAGWSNYSGAGPITNITDKISGVTTANAWTPLPNVSDGGNVHIRMAYCKAPASVGAHHTAVIVGPGGGTFAPLFFTAWSGADPTAPYNSDQVSATTVGYNVQPGSLTPPNAGALVVTFTGNISDTTSPTVDAPFTRIDALGLSPSVSLAGAVAYEIQTTATARNPAWSGVGSTSRTALIASFKAAS